jgi:hypothetical protein
MNGKTRMKEQSINQSTEGQKMAMVAVRRSFNVHFVGREIGND